jgi:hypothetical protein
VTPYRLTLSDTNGLNHHTTVLGVSRVDVRHTETSVCRRGGRLPLMAIVDEGNL